MRDRGRRKKEREIAAVFCIALLEEVKKGGKGRGGHHSDGKGKKTSWPAQKERHRTEWGGGKGIFPFQVGKGRKRDPSPA